MDQQSMEVLERRAAVEAFTRSVCDPPPMARPRDTGCDLRLARRPRIRAQRCGVKLLESSAPPGYEETARQKLAEAVRSICVSELPPTGLLAHGSREELYRLVEALCTSGRSQLVFTELSQQVVRQLEEQLSGCSAESAAERLEQLVAVWRKMCQAFRQISKIYSFLDAAFVRRLENDVPSSGQGRSSWPDTPVMCQGASSRCPFSVRHVEAALEAAPVPAMDACEASQARP
eukprot:s1353_g17.t1